ncbi:TolC family protein [Leeuwenhoekiella parthenopeia]|uniref:TolC family protein n=1 Tax=Leeuwenhoekiella parthenopeia TaxID=2890320 RepID=A0ABS8GUH9_9FLAO|nr:TolC family protein [Leeuwenhoekiella parthenopeia]MCC4213446.1 TolC family protein [Leeuwenhoekiella parthenopeia]
MKNYLFIFLLVFAGVSGFAQQKWTLQECIQRALDENIQIRQAELDLEGAAIDRSDAIGNFLPSFNANSSVSKNTGLNFDPTSNLATTTQFLSASGGINAGYTLFDGLRNFKQIQRAKLTALSAQYGLEKLQDDIALTVANGYLQVILNKENLKVLRSQNEVTRRQIEQTRELVDGGVSPRGDLLEVQAQNATEIQNITAAENAVQISLISLAQTLLIRDYKTFDIAEGDFNIYGEEILALSPEKITESAKEERYEVRIAENNLDLAEKDVEIAKGAKLPTLDAFFGYSTRYSEQDIQNTFQEQLYLNDGISYGLRLNIPILNGFQARNNVQRNKIAAERAAINLEQAQLDLESNVYQAYLDAQGALKTFEAAESAVESQELAYSYAKDRYDVGLINAFDFSQSKQRYDNAQIDLNRAKYDYIFKLKVLELYFGVPVDQLKF